MQDVLGSALWDYYNNAEGNAKLWIYNKYGPKEEMPVDTYFRNEEEMPELELTALNACRGTVLDVGAGAGSHALVLQQKGVDVTAADISPKAVEVMQQRGVRNVIQYDVFTYTGRQYDTILLLMNGIGLAGGVGNLRLLLRHLKTLLAPGGQLIFDSSDIAYLYDGNLPADKYYGEIDYEYRYKGKSSGWFSWLYIDKQTLATVATEEGWEMSVLFEDEYGQYLVRMTNIGILNT